MSINQPHDENHTLTPAEREFLGALRTVSPDDAGVDLFQVGYKAGCERTSHEMARRMRLWRGVAAAASVAMAVMLIQSSRQAPASGRPMQSPSSPGAGWASNQPEPTVAGLAEVAVPARQMATGEGATSAALPYVHHVAMVRPAINRRSSAVEQLISFGVIP